MAASSSSFVHSESLLDLLCNQRTGAEPGVRLSFHQELVERVSLQRVPYHFCAVTNTLDGLTLCAFLHERGLASCMMLTVASFSSGGIGGSTNWQKHLTVSPAEAALLAGHPVRARALQNIERGVPLHWSRQNHSRFPAKFREQFAATAAAFVSTPFLAQLPGPARQQVLDTVATQLARETVWDMLDARVWEGRWVELLGPELHAAAREQGLEPAPEASKNRSMVPQWQFRMAQQPVLQVNRLGSLCWNLARRGAGGLSLMMAAQSLGISCVPGLATFALGAVAPTASLVASGLLRGVQLNKLITSRRGSRWLH